MTTCRWNADAKDYLTPDGDPCRRDSYGDVTKHCTAKRSCSHHVGFAELTCGRCLGDVRNDIRAIADLAPLTMVEALTDGVNSEAASLAGASTDPRQYSERQVATRTHILTLNALGRITDAQYERARRTMEDDDDLDPAVLLKKWHMMIAEDYSHDLPAKMTLTRATAYLDRHLHRIAQDDEQDFPLLRREIRKCRQHLEAVLHNSTARPRGVPCPTCVEEGKPVVRLELEHGHFCTDEDCDRVNYATDEGDRWVCPRNRLHWWTAKAYRDYLEERSA